MLKRSIQKKMDRYQRKIQKLMEQAEHAPDSSSDSEVAAAPASPPGGAREELGPVILIESSTDSEEETSHRQPQRERADVNAYTSSTPVPIAEVTDTTAAARASVADSDPSGAQAPASRSDVRAHAANPNTAPAPASSRGVRAPAASTSSTTAPVTSLNPTPAPASSRSARAPAAAIFSTTAPAITHNTAPAPTSSRGVRASTGLPSVRTPVAVTSSTTTLNPTPVPASSRGVRATASLSSDRAPAAATSSTTAPVTTPDIAPVPASSRRSGHTAAAATFSTIGPVTTPDTATVPASSRGVDAPASPPSVSARATTASFAPAATISSASSASVSQPTNTASTPACLSGVRVNVAPTATITPDARTPAATAGPAPATRPDSARTELDPNTLAALGLADDATEFGEKIHEKLVEIWEPILREGLSKMDRDRLIRTYPVPENCTLLRAPDMNNEILELADHLRIQFSPYQDDRMKVKQQQFGAGIAAISSALSALLDAENRDPKLIKILTDACRILADSYNQITKSRGYYVKRDLPEHLQIIFEQCKTDETLFGHRFGEKIKRYMEAQTGTNPPRQPPRHSSSRAEYRNPGPSTYPARRPPAQRPQQPRGGGRGRNTRMPRLPY